MDDVPVVSLADAPGEKLAWSRPRWMVYLWPLVEWALVTNALQPSSRLRVTALRAFGAKIEAGVIFRPRTRVKFPWNLTVGRDAWVGEGVWLHNQDRITIGHDAAVSQETFITTGTHDFRRKMALRTRPIVIEAGAWVTSRCIITGGVTVGRSAVVRPGSLVTRDVEPNAIVGTPEAETFGTRFDIARDSTGK
jgi:putative colanic acid biosynthesis acetyltransferase WcaF